MARPTSSPRLREVATSYLRISRLFQERITLPFFSDCSSRPVSRNDDGLIRQGKELALQRLNDLVERSTRQVCSSNTACEQRVPGNQPLLKRKVKAYAAFCMPRSMQYSRNQGACLNF